MLLKLETKQHIRFNNIILFLFIGFVTISKLDAQEVHKNYTIDSVTVNSKDKIDPDAFNELLLEEIIFDQINFFLEKDGFDLKQKTNFLMQAAKDQATYMAFVESAKHIRNENVKSETTDRLRAYGGSGYGDELVSKHSIASGKLYYTYSKIANNIVFKWFASSKTVKLIKSYQFNVIGIGVKLDDAKRKVYVSVVLGNFKSFHEGYKYLSTLNTPYSTKVYGLTPYDKSACKRVDKSKNLMDLHNGLSVDNDIIYFECDNIRTVKKLIGRNKDGLAIDILQAEQFGCENPNVTNYKMVNQGVLTKRIFSKKLLKNNIVDKEESPKGFKVELGYMPEGILEDYELNLVIIKDKSVCKTISKNFIVKPIGTYTREVKLLADTITTFSMFEYSPVADSMVLSMRIPFENKKHTYKHEDIQEFIELLDEPKFLIYDLKITAYSSIEGDEHVNETLQQKRAESIVDALKDKQAEITNTNIIKEYNWIDFKKDIKTTKYRVLDTMNMDEAREYINKNKLSNDLEPILEKHRYAQIDMKIYYDIVGENEEPYVVRQFNDAIIVGDMSRSLSIEKYIIKQILSERYKPEVLNQLIIPYYEIYAGLIMNKLWLQNYTQQISREELAIHVDSLHTINPDNEYIAFNNLLLQVYDTPFTSTYSASLLQTNIDRLYYTPLYKRTIDALNIKLQFKQLSYIDTIPKTHKLKRACINKIKEIVDVNRESIQNSLTLAALFMENSDYAFALKTLEPWITPSVTNEDVLLSYVSLCSQFEMRMHSQKFNLAMMRINDLNPNLFCSLLNGDSFTIRVLENSFIKEMHCNQCK